MANSGCDFIKLLAPSNIKEWLKKWADGHIPHNRPSWDEYFINLAIVVSTRSPDAQTQHGCVIVDNQQRIVSVGYNGFPRHVDDDKLPNTRPYKYDWILHAERNALHNAKIRPDNCTAYVTGKPCFECLKAMWNEGITSVVCIDELKHKEADEDKYQALFETFCRMTGIQIRYVKPNLSFLEKIIQQHRL